MHILKFTVTDQIITYVQNRPLIADSKKHVYAHFLLDDEWDNLSVTAVFRHSALTKPVEVILTKERFEVPPEVLIDGHLFVSLVGASDNGNVCIPTAAMSLPIKVCRAGDLVGFTPDEQTPDLLHQLLAAVGPLSKLDTKDKSNLVSAINELARTGSTMLQIRIDEHTKEWEVSYDNGVTWESTGVKATGGTSAAETDAMYFVIGDDGMIALHPEYRGACPAVPAELDEGEVLPEAHFKTFRYAVSASGVGRVGAMNDRLPQDIVIPSKIDDKQVRSLAPGMFHGNDRVTSIKIPAGITEIPARFCDHARKLQHVTGTENVTKLGDFAFQISGLRKANFPNLAEIGTGVFSGCAYLTEADIGNNITAVPDHTFRNNVSLVRVEGGANIVSVGERAFSQAVSLEQPSFVPQLEYIGERGFSRSGFDYDWDTLPNCEFGENATSKQTNPSTFWKDVPYTACENPVVSCFCQADPEWKDVPIGTSDYTYSKGCLTFSSLAAYSAMTGKVFTTPLEYVAEISAVAPDLVKVDPRCFAAQRYWLDALGFELTEAFSYTSANLKKLYDALKAGNMVITDCIIEDGLYGHAVLINGITEDGKVSCVNSGSFNGALTKFDVFEARRYAIPIQNLVTSLFNPGSGSDYNKFCIVKKKPQDAGNGGETEGEEPTDEAYFEFIDDNGVSALALKSAYRGACPSNKASETPFAESDNGVEKAGSKNSELPQNIVIPDEVKDETGNLVTVTALAPGMFRGNERVTRIKIPDAVTVIPPRFCDNAKNVQFVTGTENVTTIGKCAFQTSHLLKANFPSLQKIDGDAVFAYSMYLQTANIGNVTVLPKRTFFVAQELHTVTGGANVTEVGKECFQGTFSLKSLPFLANLTFIGESAFRSTGVDYNWASLEDAECAFENNAVSFISVADTTQLHSAAFWRDFAPTACETPMLSNFCQYGPGDWKDDQIGTGTDGTTYANGSLTACCALMYSAAIGKKFNSPKEYVDAVRLADATLLARNPELIETQRVWLNALGYTLSNKCSYLDVDAMKTLCVRLESACVALTECMGIASNLTTRHVVLHGITEQGDMMFADPASIRVGKFDDYTPDRYNTPLQNLVQTKGDKDGVVHGFYTLIKKEA